MPPSVVFVRMVFVRELALGERDELEEVVMPVVDIAVGHEQRPVWLQGLDELGIVTDNNEGATPAR